MSDFETVALIVIFLVLSAIIVRLIGGDAGIESASTRSGATPQSAIDAPAAPVQQSSLQQRNSAPTQPVRTEPTQPHPIEPAMVKVDLPPPTPLPEQRIAQTQSSSHVAQPKTPSAAEALAAVRAAAPAVTQQARPAPVAPPATTTVSRLPDPPAKTPVQAPAATNTAPTPTIRPSAAATIAPVSSPQKQAATTPSAPSGPAINASAPVEKSAAQNSTLEPKPVVPQAAQRAPIVHRISSAGVTPPPTQITLTRPNVSATLAPGAKPVAATGSWVAPRQQLSPAEQAIISGYLRADVKATLFRDPPPGWTPPPPAAPRPAEPQQAVARAAPVTPTPAGPLVITKPSAAGTVPPGYQAPKSQPKAPPVEGFTGFAPLGIKPDARATLASADNSVLTSAKAAAAPVPQASTIEPSPRAERPSPIPPSAAGARPGAAQTAPQVSSTLPSFEPGLVSTAKRGTRVIGAEASNNDAIELERPTAARPQAASIWSNTVTRRVAPEGEAQPTDAPSAALSVRAERVPVRAETLLVRPDAAKTIDPTAPKYTAIPKAPPVASLPNEARSATDTGNRANVKYTLPPGALGAG